MAEYGYGGIRTLRPMSSSAPTDTSEGPTTYTVMESTKSGRNKLVSSTLYHEEDQQWDYPLAVCREEQQYHRYLSRHRHAEEGGLQTGVPQPLSPARAGRLSVEPKKQAKDQVFEPASNLVDDILLEAGNQPGMPSHAALLHVRRLNRAKAKMRPEEPRDLMNFELNEHLIPDDFLRFDIPVIGRQRWYVDGSFNNDERVHRWPRRLLCLPYLPPAAMRPALEAPGEVEGVQPADGDDKSVRTTNDVEGCHNRLNLKAKKPNLPLYLLINLLHKKSRVVTVYTKQVSEGNLQRYQRAAYRRVQGRLFSQWDKFAAGELTVKGLLDACSKIFGPFGM
ncbi:hypothetical protein Bbelb_319050 [Branchiostoma belcheri]|nr:hypothetical protein Bbelb_319050 [Branchiostoma belcheri]